MRLNGGWCRQLCLCWLLAGLVTACNLAQSPPLPTLMPLATVPAFSPGPTNRLAALPGTYTPVPPPTLLPTPTRRQPPTPTLRPSPAPTATETPTPTPAAQSQALAAGSPYQQGPPRTTPCNGQGTVFRSRFLAGSDGAWHPYSAYLPPCYGHDGRVYPVLYLIHGSIQTDSHWLDLGLKGLADAGIAAGRYPSFIAIMPYNGELGNITSGGGYSVEGVVVNDLIPFVARNFCDWEGRAGRHLGGISRGGYWALEIAFRQPYLFSAVAGHSSQLRLETDAAKYNPLATYATADLGGLRIWLDLGENDFLRPGQEELHNKLLAAGIPHDFHLNPGGHNDGYWAANLGSYLAWQMIGWPLDRGAYPECAGA